MRSSAAASWPPPARRRAAGAWPSSARCSRPSATRRGTWCPSSRVPPSSSSGRRRRWRPTARHSGRRAPSRRRRGIAGHRRRVADGAAARLGHRLLARGGDGCHAGRRARPLRDGVAGRGRARRRGPSWRPTRTVSSWPPTVPWMTCATDAPRASSAPIARSPRRTCCAACGYASLTTTDRVPSAVAQLVRYERQSARFLGFEVGSELVAVPVADLLDFDARGASCADRWR